MGKLLKIKVYDLDNKEVEDLSVPGSIFDVELKPDIVAKVVNWQLSNKRQGSHKVKERNEISGSTAKIYRQKDAEFIYILNKIRSGNVTEADLLPLNDKVVNQDSNVLYETIILSPTNRKVDTINSVNLQNINSETFSYQSSETGEFREKPADEILELKVGAQVMLIKNDIKSPKRWVNGSIGIVTDLTANSIHLKIKNKVHKITQDTWEKFDYLIKDGEVLHEVVATFTQYPIKLAWAVTIHKSQGQTFEKVIIDLDRGSFAPGQTYVALSRVTSLEGLFLTRPINISDILFNNKLSLSLFN